MTTIEATKVKRKFSQSCDSKQDFIDMIWEMRDAAEKAKPDPECLLTEERQNAFNDGKWSAFDWILMELAKSPDTRTY